MIDYHYQTDFELERPKKYTEWIIKCIHKLGGKPGPINFIYCSDDDLLRVNQEYLDHDFYTDIITFQYEAAPVISGDIYISVDRVLDNAKTFKEKFSREMKRVMIHGVLHLLGYQDKTEEEKIEMRSKETEMMGMFHVKH